MSHKFPIENARKAKAAREAALGDLRKGKLTLVKAIREPPDALKSVDIWDLLLSCHGLGREGARIVLERAKVWPHTKLGDLLKIERYNIVKALPERVK